MIGGVGDTIDLQENRKGDKAKKENLFQHLQDASENHSLLSASITVSNINLSYIINAAIKC